MTLQLDSLLKQLVEKIKKSDFLKHTAILTSGTVIAQIISMCSALITYRIYQPYDYGTLGLFMTASSLISVFTTLQYHNAIITAEKEEDSISVAFLSIYITIAVTFITFIIVIFFDKIFNQSIENQDLVSWLITLPVSIFFTGLNFVFSALAIRKQKFKLLSINRVIAAVIVPLISIAIGLLHKGPAGLIIGLLVSQILSTILLVKHFSDGNTFSLKHSYRKVHGVIKKYRNFPLYSFPADWINNFTNQVPIFLLNYVGGSAAVGFFNLSNRILGMPSQLISSSIGETFRQRATKDYFENGSCKRIFINVLITLIVIGAIPFALVALAGPQIFSFVFGQKWQEAGDFSQIFSILFFFKFVVSPLTYVTYISNKQWIGLIIDVLLLATILIIMGLAKYNNIHYKKTLLIYSLAYSALYFLTLWVSYKLTKNVSYAPKT